MYWSPCPGNKIRLPRKIGTFSCLHYSHYSIIRNNVTELNYIDINIDIRQSLNASFSRKTIWLSQALPNHSILLCIHVFVDLDVWVCLAVNRGKDRPKILFIEVHRYHQIMHTITHTSRVHLGAGVPPPPHTHTHAPRPTYSYTPPRVYIQRIILGI